MEIASKNLADIHHIIALFMIFMTMQIEPEYLRFTDYYTRCIWKVFALYVYFEKCLLNHQFRGGSFQSDPSHVLAIFLISREDIHKYFLLSLQLIFKSWKKSQEFQPALGMIQVL